MTSRAARFVVIAFILALGLVGTSIALAGGGKGKHDKKGDSTFTAHLTGLGENPSLWSPATADLKLTIGNDQLTWTLKYSGFVDQPSAAHVHISAPGVNGGVAFFFCGGGGKPACPSSAGGPVTITGTTVPTDVLGPTAQHFPAGQLDPIVTAIKAGVAYANMHTAPNPNGEIRGQLERGHHHGGGDHDDD